MQPKTSRDLPPSAPKRDEKREKDKAAATDAAETDQADRDNVHGDGAGIGLDRT